jgi:hypothetical protein
MSIWTDINGWPIPPFVLLGCLAVEFLYFRGWCVLIKDTQHPYATGNMHLPASTDANDATMLWKRWFWRGIFFLGASFSFLLAAWAPIDNLSGRLFWVHMIQHLLLLVVMAPLLVASAPLMPLWAGLPARLRRFIKLSSKALAFFTGSGPGYNSQRLHVRSYLLASGSGIGLRSMISL